MPGPYSSLMVLRRRASRSGPGRAVRGRKTRDSADGALIRLLTSNKDCGACDCQERIRQLVVLRVSRALRGRARKRDKEAGEVVSREEGEAIYRATLESLLASTGWTPRAAEERAREEQRAHVRQMRWAREHGRGEPVRCFDAEEYDEGDDAFDALFDGGSGYGWDSPSGGGAFF
ncbi:hypothetical protein EMIHUDRAFT_193732 [Emiliania huxleyi CCMP1516]|uniref:CCD97-like C-terminal domain-containing protein n=2 Tax=Emiliania huxleyi TaxID=2903 RepID=A0A0D3L0C8_EMIH1|nr:hypothetical protein EMIHUDRAFT_193732 [Emiliania huxleyi CCMP1516]EOD41463.1 hypothetical protein EMIHUDRAFT_193732 [Emiliania huxleyi CCMP1516]|eukprot:XP_005793892.1 hypothetical protein EMIHUDRAFT_193732 [Emiliania huxleyi CCMP1516]